MIRYFFEMPNDKCGGGGKRVSDELFSPLKISAADYNCIREAYMGKYPIIQINFRCNTPILSYKAAIQKCKTVIHNAYNEHKYLFDENSELDSSQKDLCRKWCDDKNYEVNFPDERLDLHLVNLSKLGRQCMVIVDEYNSICSNAVFEVSSENLDNVIQFTMGILLALIKDKYVGQAFLTGIIQICSMGMSGVNILLSATFAPYYGFTEAEFKNLLCRENISKESKSPLFEDGIDYYNGYEYEQFTLFNPRAIVNYLHIRDSRVWFLKKNYPTVSISPSYSGFLTANTTLCTDYKKKPAELPYITHLSQEKRKDVIALLKYVLLTDCEQKMYDQIL